MGLKGMKPRVFSDEMLETVENPDEATVRNIDICESQLRR